MWFAIILQLLLNAIVIYSTVTVTVSIHRLQISVFTVIVIVFAVIGVDANIFAPDPSQKSMAAAWILLCIIDIIWLLYFTSHNQSPLLRLFGQYEAAETADPEAQDEPHDGPILLNTPPATTDDVPLPPVRPIHSWTETEDTTMTRTFPGDQSREMLPPRVPWGPQTTISETDPARFSSLTVPASGTTASSMLEYTMKAEAKYDFTGSDDPEENELSFKKGETLSIAPPLADRKWWEAKTVNGLTGIVPSNYMKLIS
ncbi:hypothetical protein C8J56DRAFT_144621 [Mycena floridula]|nr:hypothetical protein C8J56DRAFT_144621 [Mycena floridula]